MMGAYFQNIKNGFSTVFEGMSITFATMFVRKVTVQYPEVDITSNKTIAEKYKGSLMGMPDNYRGILKLDSGLCTACQICQRACPIDCIAIENAKCDKIKPTDRDGKSVLNRFTQKEAIKTRALTRFDINVAKCMFCGLCEAACPTGAIHHTKQFEMNCDTQEELVLRFVSEGEREVAVKRADEIEAEAAAKKAAKAEKEKEEQEKGAEE
jgi:formate hydrogenlyase subunit 6/NADH:ubiquinone oxidoreductase subunit I